MVDKNKQTWPDKLPKALWAYRTTVRMATQTTPYLLVFDGEAVLPLEVQLPPPKSGRPREDDHRERANLHLAEREVLDTIGSQTSKI